MSTLKDKTLFITGASRGIGKAIALRAAADGANVAIAAKTVEPHPILPGTIYTAAEEIEAAGGRALPLAVDIRDEERVREAMAETDAKFGGIDILVNNASAISLTGTRDTPMKRFDLMWSVNARGTFLCSQGAIPYLERAANPHILNLAPPLEMAPKWFRRHTAYSMAKYGMSLCVLGMAAELAPVGIAVNALWPRTVIATAALRVLGGAISPANCRHPEILADAAHWIVCQDAGEVSGNFFIDEQVLERAGITDLEGYAVEPGRRLIADFFVPDDLLEGLKSTYGES